MENENLKTLPLEKQVADDPGDSNTDKPDLPTKGLEYATPLVSCDNDPQKRKSTDRSNLFFILLTIAILLVFAAYMLFGRSSSAEKITDLMTVGNYSAAYDMYIENYGRGNADSDLIQALTNRLNTLEEEFSEQNISYERCCDEMDAMREMNIAEVNSVIERAADYIDDCSREYEAYAWEDNEPEESVTPESNLPVIRPTTQLPEPKPQTEPLADITHYAQPRIVAAYTLEGDVLPESNVNVARSFGADKAIDGYYDSCWCVTTDDIGGAGASIRFDLYEQNIVNGVRLINGNLYEPEYDIYKSNGQIKEFRLTFSNGVTKTFTASYNADASYEYEYFTFDTPVATDSITLTVLSGYAGEKYNINVCLGEFEAY